MQPTNLFAEQPDRGDQFGDYTLLERIGRGGEGTIWSGWDNRRQRVVAIKVLPAHSSSALVASQVSTDFERQIHLLASLEHPHILPLYEFGGTDDYYYLVMRYSCIGSLSNLLLGGPLSPSAALSIIAQISSALEYLHRHSIVHRDLKPSNILLDSQQRVYLADFGIAKRLIEETAPLHTGRGTGPYAPYEQHMPNLMTPQSDIYSLGVMIYEMFTGQLPWDKTRDLAAAQFDQGPTIPDLHLVNPALPPALSAVLRKMTAFEWAMRPSSASHAFEQIVETFPPELQQVALKHHRVLPTFDDAGLAKEDAFFLAGMFVPDWRSAEEAFPARLTHFAYIDAAFTEDGSKPRELSSAQRLFLLRGAIVYDYHLDYWWQVADPKMRMVACEHTLAHESDDAITRALARLSRESSLRTASDDIATATLDRLIDLAMGAKGWSLRNDAVKLLSRIAPEAAAWQPVGISESGDAKLAMLAGSSSSHAKQAAQLIGRLRSKHAVNALIEAHQLSDETAQLAAILRDIQSTAGSLPSSVPLNLRLQVIATVMRAQLLEDREGLSWSRSLIGMTIGLLLSLAMIFGVFSALESQMRDVLMSPYPTSDIVTVVEVNDQSLELYGRWDSWPRSLHAQLVNRLSDAGAKVIAFDFLFDTETSEDRWLAEAMESAGNVILPVLGQGDAFHETSGSVKYGLGVYPQTALSAAASAIGHTNILHDEDGYVRRIPTVISIEGDRYPGLSLSAIEIFLGVDLDDTAARIPPFREGKVSFAGREIPVNEYGAMSIYYAGPPAADKQSTFRTVSYQDVIDQKIPAGYFRDKIVLVGMTATAEPDRYLTPVSQGRPMYGVEILANVIESIWSGRFIFRPGEAVRGIILVVLGIVTGLICTRPWSGLLFASLLAFLYFVVVVWVFELNGIMLDILFPSLTIAFSYATVTAYRYSIAVRRRHEIMQLFQERVTPEVAQATIEAVKKGEINLEGRVQDISVVMVDIRGYQEYAELYQPEAVLSGINELRSMMVETVFSFDGTVAQYEGDQLMAIFNAPLPQTDHAWRAVETALMLKEQMANHQMSLPADHPYRLLTFGFCAFTGRAIVGHMGASQRYAYSAMGSAIVTASYLAKSAKSSQVIIGDATYEGVRDSVIVKPMPPIQIKGDPNPVLAYSAAKRKIVV